MTRLEPAEPCPRRATPLADDLRRALRQDGANALSVHDCMAACVAHYYARGRVFGRDGDFVTAPEISQIFGEVIGLWCAVVWQQMGCPRAFNLVEIGPGRATMLRDAVRALRVVPSCLAAARLCLIEPNRALFRSRRTPSSCLVKQKPKHKMCYRRRSSFGSVLESKAKATVVGSPWNSG